MFAFVVYGHYVGDYVVKTVGTREECDAASKDWFADHPNAHYRDAYVRAHS